MTSPVEDHHLTAADLGQAVDRRRHVGRAGIVAGPDDHAVVRVVGDGRRDRAPLEAEAR